MTNPIKNRLQLPVFVTCLMIAAGMAGQAAAQDESQNAASIQFFETHIRPLLHAKCVRCHGQNEQEGHLRLDSLEALLKGGESGPAAVPGKAHESLLLEAVRYESFEMPPDKRLKDEEILHLEQWIAAGAAWPMHEGKSVRLEGAVFSEDERQFWSLQPLTAPAVPSHQLNWGNNAIDQFIAAELQAADIQPAPRASDETLVRRLYFNMLGVPPSPEDMAAFVAATNGSLEGVEGNRSAAWSDLVEQLLADSRYGEHWARYWLDIVRYAESDGFRADFYRPDAWRYRDYVVDAFNNDKPYDQFVREQLAGDEIAPHRAEALIATGYLRTYLYEYNQRDARTQWQDILNQVTDVTGEAFLGMSVGCARCHDHKFDPILQEDYFRMQASFGTMVPRDDVPAADLDERQQYSQAYQAWLAQGSELRNQLEQIREPYIQRAAKGAIKRFPEDIQEIMAKAPEDRVPLENQLADLVNRQVLFDQQRAKVKEEDKVRIEQLEQQIAELAGKEPPKLPSAISVTDLGARPQPVHLAGNPNNKVVPAGGFTILEPAPFELRPTESSTGQRTALANWIASPENPLTARVIVNRVWQQHFGTGLVETASDFGTLGGQPSHPELLDWLTSQFIAHDWSIKWLQRQILNSAVWQMSAFHPEPQSAEKIDPANSLRWRADIRRLNAEQVRDTMLEVSGELRSERGGPSVDHKSLRRSLYLKVMRNTPEPLMKSLDGVDGLNSVAKRSTTTTPTQALNLMNGEWVRNRANAMASRVLDQTAGTSSADLADTAFRIALGRAVQPDELPLVDVLLTQAAPESRQPATANWYGSLTEDTGSAVKIGDNALPSLATTTKDLSLEAPFTFAGLFRLNSLYPDATVRTIVSQWDSNNKNRGWAIGVTSQKSAYQPRNLILQVVSDHGYEVVASNLRPELNVTYVVAVAVHSTDNGKGTARFLLQPVNTDYNDLQTAEVEFKSARGITGDFPVMLGGRTRQRLHKWDGQLDQVSLFATSLPTQDIKTLFEQRLSASALESQKPIALWAFDDAEQPFADSTPAGHHLQASEDRSLNPTSPLQTAVAELCHVLLNSNEFVYID